MDLLRHQKSSLLTALAAVFVLTSGCQWFFGGGYEIARPRSGSVPIMGRGQSTPRQMAALLRSRNKSISFDAAKKFAELYIEESRIEGINADVAFAQMCLETDFLRFGGQVSSGQNNFCGLGATDDGAAGASFPSPRAGIRAHIQHLKAYASRAPLRTRVIDPRFDLVKRGSAPNIEQLAGTWATDQAYADKIKRLLVRLKQA